MDDLTLSYIELSDLNQGNATLGVFALGNPWETMGYLTMGNPIPDSLALSNVTLSYSMWDNFMLSILPWVKHWYFFFI